MNSNLLTFAVIGSLTIGGLQAREVQQEDGAYLITLGAGQVNELYEIGIGIKPTDGRAGFGGLVFKRQSFNDQQTLAGKSLGEQETTITSLGVRGFAIQVDSESNKGADLTFAVSQTQTGDYERTGMDIRGLFYAPIAPSVSWFAGASLRPEFLSFDWNTASFSELGLEAGIDWRLTPALGISGGYHREMIITDDLESWLLADGLEFSLQLIW
ncbi:hypothetical protein FJM67_14145 [Maribrevibacterium harenarium]|uniref:Outer membrane protein beta-barrel domain-containing protein n=1 Tax=Maribrevibacterium harenarium TaxID=2589817 RepID=A0A501WG13_9GAMM|nr:hypothetical protein [Maribrevibacterium harenarium]TPE47742.1 hypothetical protein FJM67_14145 [Maribrevibacterium harenarium]